MQVPFKDSVVRGDDGEHVRGVDGQAVLIRRAGHGQGALKQGPRAVRLPG